MDKITDALNHRGDLALANLRLAALCLEVRFPPSLLDDIRARLPVTAVVGRRVRLVKAGREWKGLSPFNSEKTPSFYVNDQKGFYHCFSSGQHGDIFRFLMATEGLSFPEAVERLAADAGVELPKASPDFERVMEQRRDLHEVVELACRFFEAELQKHAGARARTYLHSRAVTPETQAEFRLGYAPESRTALLDHLRGKGIEDDLILRAGLAVRPDSGRNPYDRFRGRLIIPIQDLKGRVVAFGGRALGADQQPKYLNGPETDIFAKGRMVFNGHRAREAAFKSGNVVVVEGYIDAISAYQAGARAVVATLGTAFTEEQIAALWQFAPEPILCFDGDRAGRAAAFRALDRMLALVRVGRSFRFAFLPNGKDPDDLVREQGIEAFRNVLEGARKLWDVLWERESASVEATNPDAIAGLDARLRALIGQITDGQLRYRYELSARIHINDLFWKATRRHLSAGKQDVSRFSLLRASDLFASQATRFVGLERLFLGLCVEYPDFADQARDAILAITFRGSHKLADGGELPFGAFVTSLLDLLDQDGGAGTADIYAMINPAFHEMLDHIHGRATPDHPIGHRLRKRFPILGYYISEEYISRCFWHFLDMLVQREMEDELVRELSTLPDEIDADSSARFIAHQAEILERRDRILARENELAEEAGAWKAAMKPALRLAA